MADLTPTQTRILSAGAQRPGSLAMPLPKGLHGAAANKVVTMLITRGFIEEVDANSHKGAPLWRETGDAQGTTLVVTEAGLEAIGIKSVVAKTMARVRKAGKITQPSDALIIPRAGTKQALLIAMLKEQGGASIDEITTATNLQPHTIRGMISGVLKKKLGLAVISEKVEGRGRAYRIET